MGRYRSTIELWLFLRRNYRGRQLRYVIASYIDWILHSSDCSITRCPPGPRGHPGLDGIAAIDGMPGEPGRPGIDGIRLLNIKCEPCPPGKKGPPGLPGERGTLLLFYRCFYNAINIGLLCRCVLCNFSHVFSLLVTHSATRIHLWTFFGSNKSCWSISFTNLICTLPEFTG